MDAEDKRHTESFGESQGSQGGVGRREFLKRVGAIGGGSAAVLLGLGEYAAAATVAANDERLETEHIKYKGETGEVRAYFARPKGDKKLPAVIVIHENRGLQPHIKDVARRVALEGYVAIAPDGLSPLGGTPEDIDKARELIGQLDQKATVKNFVAAVQYLKTHPQSTGKVACMGFCWGGGMTNHVAVNAADLDGAIPFYGMQPAVEDVPKIKAAMLCHYAGDDQRINAGIAAFEAAMKKAGTKYEIFMYEGAGHAFFNDTNESRYNRKAAELAWQRTVDFLKKTLTREARESPG